MPTHDAAIKPEDERDFLVEVGRRVRQCRHAISMTRRQLAERSGLSERYLAQLEAGDGNISILLIRRVARVLKVDLARLLAEPAEQLSSRPTRIALLSLPDAESEARLARVAALLSTALGTPLLDIGAEVSEDLGVSPPEAVSRFGVEVCRDVQRRSLLRLTATHRRCVVRLGQLPAPDGDLLRLLHERCVTVWLRESGAGDAVRAGALHAEARYAEADHWVEVESCTPEQIQASIQARIERNFVVEPHYRSRVTDRQGQWSRPAA